MQRKIDDILTYNDLLQFVEQKIQDGEGDYFVYRYKDNDILNVNTRTVDKLIGVSKYCFCSIPPGFHIEP